MIQQKLNNNIISANVAHVIYRYNRTSLPQLGGAFLFATIQPFKWHCDYIGINQLREVQNLSLITSTELYLSKLYLCVHEALFILPKCEPCLRRQLTTSTGIFNVG